MKRILKRNGIINVPNAITCRVLLRDSYLWLGSIITARTSRWLIAMQLAIMFPTSFHRMNSRWTCTNWPSAMIQQNSSSGCSVSLLREFEFPLKSLSIRVHVFSHWLFCGEATLYTRIWEVEKMARLYANVLWEDWLLPCVSRIDMKIFMACA